MKKNLMIIFGVCKKLMMTLFVVLIQKIRFFFGNGMQNKINVLSKLWLIKEFGSVNILTEINQNKFWLLYQILISL
jgi:hypothetical protein